MWLLRINPLMDVGICATFVFVPLKINGSKHSWHRAQVWVLDLHLMSGDDEVVRDSKNKISVTKRGADHYLTNSHRECESTVPGERYITLEDIFYGSCKGIPG